MNLIIFWLIILILFLVVEAATMGLTTIWFAGGSLVSLLLALAGVPVYVQVIVFFVISFLLLFCTRPVAVRYFNRERVKTNIDSVVGSKAVVVAEIDNLKGTGKVSLNGMEWTAMAADGTTILPDAVVLIKEIRGVKLVVEREREET